MMILVSAFLLLVTSAAFAASPPQELVSACRGDAESVCSWTQLIKAAGGNYHGINQCFRSQHDKLSVPCKSMLVKYGYNK